MECLDLILVVLLELDLSLDQLDIQAFLPLLFIDNSLFPEFLSPPEQRLSPDYIGPPELNRGLNPAHDSADDGRLICVGILDIIVFNVAFNEVDRLILSVLVLLLPHRLVVVHQVPQVRGWGDHLLGKFPLELVGARLTDRLPVDLQEVEKGLPDAGVFDHGAVVQSTDCFL